MPKTSAGLLLFKRGPDGLAVLLVHPGGPFWAKKDAGSWSIPKGEAGDGEDLLAVALREFAEETGASPPGGIPIPLGEARQAGGKRVHAFAAEGDLDANAIVSNRFEMEWPPRGGVRESFPEVDRVEWFSLAAARDKINPAQRVFLERLKDKIG